MNAHPETLDVALMDKAGAKWMRVIANFLPYYLGTRAPGTKVGTDSWDAFLQSASPVQHDYTEWTKFIDAHNNGKKGMINIEWDFEVFNLHIPAASSTAEIKLFKYLDEVFLPKVLPFADILVVGNEPFLNTLSDDTKKDPITNTVPITEFYKRVAAHINTYMVNKEKGMPSSPEARSKHKLYLGAFTHLYGPNMQKLPAAVDLLDFANNTDYIDGIDIHTHGYSLQDVTDSLAFASKHVSKPITDTEYSYVYEQGRHLNDLITANDTHTLSGIGLSFLEKYQNATATKSYRWRNGTTSTVVRQIGQRKYTATTTVAEFMGMASSDPVPVTEWNDFFKSRTWTIDHFVKNTNAIFNKYFVNGVTFGFMQGGVTSVTDGAPWFMVPVYASSTVQHLLNGYPQGNYQNLSDFQTINHVPVTP
jgi:hypothetical protein